MASELTGWPARGLPPVVAERLYAAKKARGMSMHALAEQIGVSLSMCQKILAGKRRPSISTALLLSDALILDDYTKALMLAACGRRTSRAAPGAGSRSPAPAGA